MKAIKRYFLDKNVTVNQTIYLPDEAEITDVKDTSKGLNLYALVDITKPAISLHTFKILNTGEAFYADNCKYIGSFEGNYGVRHVIEIF